MIPSADGGLLFEAAGLTAIMSAVFALISLGGLALAQSTDERTPRGWIASSWISWSVCVSSLVVVAAMAPAG
ncbi:hypothetical protein [Amnibacterium sp.]|uniref:hypothetical protein n=1 Tax=Microbacteriaceae TaxID=85023 RepID=UPI003F7CA157